MKCEVWLDHEELKRAQDSGENAWVIQQVHIAEMAEEQQADATWAEIDNHRYYDSKTGLPIAPKGIKDLLSRESDQHMWIDAVNKEIIKKMAQQQQRLVQRLARRRGGMTTPSSRSLAVEGEKGASKRRNCVK